MGQRKLTQVMGEFFSGTDGGESFACACTTSWRSTRSAPSEGAVMLEWWPCSWLPKEHQVRVEKPINHEVNAQRSAV
jgi:hypothetical protein